MWSREKKIKKLSIFPWKLTLHAYLLPNIILQDIKMTTKTCFFIRTCSEVEYH